MSSHHLLVDRVAVPALLHVDEVDDDQAADVAQADLAGDLLGGLEVDGVERVLLLARARSCGSPC